MSQPVDVHALAGAYALDAVDDLERTAFGRHLAQCGACAVEVAELRETAAFLAATAEEAPPPRLRVEVISAARRTRQVGPARADREPPTNAAAVARWRRWTAGAVAASVLAIGAATGTYVVQEQQIGAERRETAALREVLSAPDAVLERVAVDRGGSVTVAVSPSRDNGVVLLNGLPPTDSAHSYQLWLITDGTPRSIGVLPPGTGTAVQTIDGVRGADAVGVSYEVAGGAGTPSQPLVSTLPLA